VRTATSTASAAAAIHHLFRVAGGVWLRSRFPTVRTLAERRRARQLTCDGRAATSGWIQLLGSALSPGPERARGLTDNFFGSMKIAR